MLSHKVSIINTDCRSICAKFSKSTHIFANFTLAMIGNDSGHLLKCVKYYSKFSNISETLHMLKRKIGASSLKSVGKSLNSVKSYYKTNMFFCI